MAWVPMAIQIAGVVLSAYGAMKQGQAQKQQAQQMQQAKEFEAAQMDQNAGQETAAAQRRALEERRRATMVASRALAVASASGGGTSGSAEEIISDIAGEGAYRSALEIYGGEDRARRLRMGAAGARYEGDSIAEYGRSRASAGMMSGLGTLASGGLSLYQKYGQGGPSSGGSGGKLAGDYLDAGTPLDPRFG